MKTLYFMIGVALLALFVATSSRASVTTVAGAQKQVDIAQAKFDRAKENAEAGMLSSDKSSWRQAEAKFDNLISSGANPNKLSAPKAEVQEVESHAMKSSDRDSVDEARDNLVSAYTMLYQAKARVTPRPVHDDSSQAIQQENRTQNGANFSIRSERDSENHQPLPSSQ